MLNHANVLLCMFLVLLKDGCLQKKSILTLEKTRAELRWSLRTKSCPFLEQGNYYLPWLVCPSSVMVAEFSGTTCQKTQHAFEAGQCHSHSHVGVDLPPVPHVLYSKVLLFTEVQASVLHMASLSLEGLCKILQSTMRNGLWLLSSTVLEEK